MWMYLVVQLNPGNERVDETLNAYGKKGWELVCITEAVPLCHLAFFKRRVTVVEENSV